MTVDSMSVVSHVPALTTVIVLSVWHYSYKVRRCGAFQFYNIRTKFHANRSDSSRIRSKRSHDNFLSSFSSFSKDGSWLIS